MTSTPPPPPPDWSATGPQGPPAYTPPSPPQRTKKNGCLWWGCGGLAVVGVLIVLLGIIGLIFGDFNDSSDSTAASTTSSAPATTAEPTTAKPTTTTEPTTTRKPTTTTAAPATTAKKPTPPVPTPCAPDTVLQEVFVRIEGDTLLVDWTATRQLSPELNGFYLNLGSYEYQVGVKMIDASEVVGFVFDNGTVRNKDLADAETNGMTASLVVPLSDLPGVDRATEWDAAATENGNDVGVCPATPKPIG